MQKLLSLLNVRPNESRLVLLLLFHSFLIGGARIFTRIAAFTLFLVEFEAQTLPYVYIAISLVVTLTAFIYFKLGEHLPLSRLLIVNLSFLIVLLIGFWMGLAATQARWLIFSLPIWYEVLWVLTNLEFWKLTGRLLNVRQGKRLFGLVSAGEPAAVIIGGLLVYPLVALIGTPNLLLLAAGMLIITLGLLIVITRLFPNQLNLAIRKTPTGDIKLTTKLLKNKYRLLVFGLFTLWIVVYFFIDNIFYAVSQVQYPSESQLAGFIGLFFGAAALLTLVSQTFLSGPIINRYGVWFGLLITPIILSASTASMAIIGTISNVILYFFWLAVVTKLLNVILRNSIDRPVLNILYQPLPPIQRTQIQTVVEGLVYPVAIGVAGVTLLVLTRLFEFEVVQLSYVLLFILAILIVVAVLLGKEYFTVLIQALAKRKLGNFAPVLSDASSVSVLRQALKNSHPGPVIYAMDMLEKSSPQTLVASLPNLLKHPAPEVRQEALHRIKRLDLTDLLDSVSEELQTESSSSVRATALSVLACLGEPDTLEQIYPYLEDHDLQVKKEAIVGLLRYGGVEVTIVAEGKLLQLAVSANPAERVLAAQIIGQVAARNLRQLLEQLLQDENLHVRRVALMAAGKAKYTQLWPQVIAALSIPEVRSAATSAMVMGGEDVLPKLESVLIQPNQDHRLVSRLAHICGRIGGDKVISLLINQLAYPVDETRTKILSALNQCGYQAKGDQEQQSVQQQLEAEVAKATQTLAMLVDLDLEPMSLLSQTLNHQLVQSRSRLLLLLSFIYDPQLIRQIRDNLSLKSSQKRAYALETIDVLIAPNQKSIILPLLEDLPPNQRLQRLKTSFPQTVLDRSQRLVEIITDPTYSSWQKACALYTVGNLKLSSRNIVKTVTNVFNTPQTSPLIIESAAWTFARFNKNGTDRPSSDLLPLANPQLEAMIESFKATKNGDRIMLSTVEKVIILKTVDIFAGTPDEILVEVAALLEEVELTAGETMFEKGDQGDCMYIIVSGEVRVHDGDHTLNHLGQGDVFGEMAVLDPEPRVASVTALEDMLLLRLDQEPFYELMEDRIEVTRGIIHVLSGHLRNRIRDLNELHAQLQTLQQVKP